MFNLGVGMSGGIIRPLLSKNFKYFFKEIKFGKVFVVV